MGSGAVASGALGLLAPRCSAHDSAVRGLSLGVCRLGGAECAGDAKSGSAGAGWGSEGDESCGGCPRTADGDARLNNSPSTGGAAWVAAIAAARTGPLLCDRCGLRGNCGLRGSCGLRGNCGLRGSCGLRGNCGLRPICGLRGSCGLRGGRIDWARVAARPPPDGGAATAPPAGKSGLCGGTLVPTCVTPPADIVTAAVSIGRGLRVGVRCGVRDSPALQVDRGVRRLGAGDRAGDILSLPVTAGCSGDAASRGGVRSVAAKSCRCDCGGVCN